MLQYGSDYMISAVVSLEFPSQYLIYGTIYLIKTSHKPHIGNYIHVVSVNLWWHDVIS